MARLIQQHERQGNPRSTQQSIIQLIIRLEPQWFFEDSRIIAVFDDGTAFGEFVLKQN